MTAKKRAGRKQGKSKAEGAQQPKAPKGKAKPRKTDTKVRRPVIAPLPSLPAPLDTDAAAEKPQLRLAGERQIGGNPIGELMRQPHGTGAESGRPAPRKRGVYLPEGHAPREVLGDAAALFQAARTDRADEVRRLIGNGADPDLTDDPGNEHCEAIAFMCRNEDIGEDNLDGIKFGRTACHMAAVRGHTEVVLALIEGGCDVNLADHAGKTAVMRAARAGFIEATRLLVHGGADVDARDLRQSTPLLRAAGYGRAEVVRYLLESGADVEACNCEGRTALIAAAAGVHADAVRELLAAGADTHPRDATGADALSAAIDAVEPSDPNAPSPFHVVREERVLAVVALLIDAGVRDEPDEAGVWPSGRAEERGHADVATLLRESG